MSESKAELNNASAISTAADGPLGLVLSGGGSRTAYQVGALRALAKCIESEDDKISVVVGSSIGAVNSLIIGNCMHFGLGPTIEALHALWRERTFRNTFEGSPSKAFLRTIKVAILRYSSPSPIATNVAIFNPTPLRLRVDSVLEDFQSRTPPPGNDAPLATAVMATVEGKERKPLLFVASHERMNEEQMKGASFSVSYVPRLTAAHGLASAALPSVLPPVVFDVDASQIRIVDGGISDNIPIDPAVRLGASRIITVDCSGRRWWFDHYNEPHDTRPKWEVPAIENTFCFCPMDSMELRSRSGMGPILKDSVGRSTRDFISALGPTWPIFKILKHQLGEVLAYEIMSYVALHPGYFEALLDLGYRETKERLKNGFPLSIKRNTAEAHNSTAA